MDDIIGFMEEDPATSLFGEFVVAIFGLHGRLAENAVEILKIGTVMFDDLTKYLSLNLIVQFLKGVAVDEEILQPRMPMQVKIKVNSWHLF